LRLLFRRPFGLEFRAYDDGAAYRFALRRPDSAVVVSEQADFRFAEDPEIWYPVYEAREGADAFHTSFEPRYDPVRLSRLGSRPSAFTPVLARTSAGLALITESDLDDYPGLWLAPDPDRLALSGRFAAWPEAEALRGSGVGRQWQVTRRAPFLARTAGTRAFPWRVLALARRDADLPANDIAYRLAPACRVPDPSWVRPGQCTDEWILGIALHGVDFKAGVNTATYRHYAEFAARAGIEYVMLDAGWSDPEDPSAVTPGLDLAAVVRAADSLGVGVWLWTNASALAPALGPTLDRFRDMGLAGFMVDFFDRDDQKAVNRVKVIAEAAAVRRLMVMFHGVSQPAGFGRPYPNALTREGLMGSEYNLWRDWVTPGHDAVLPFTRMAAGPMDYEPGLTDNAAPGRFRAIEGKVMSQGTRAHQLALFAAYDSPLQVFSGDPDIGRAEPRFARLLGSIPTVWDETLPLDGRVGDFYAVARRRGTDWFLAALTDESARELTVDLRFMGSGDYEAEACADGVNADRYGSDYTLSSSRVRASDALTLRLAPGGGYLARFRPAALGGAE
jgi:alpha-glucosidase